MIKDNSFVRLGTLLYVMYIIKPDYIVLSTGQSTLFNVFKHACYTLITSVLMTITEVSITLMSHITIFS